MPRKFFKKYLLSHDNIKRNRFVGLFGGLLKHHNLWHLHRRSVAGGVAVGLFTGLIPGSNPIQFFFAAVFSAIFKVNLPVAVFTTLYSNPFTIVPIYYVAYTIGSLVTGHGAGSFPETELNLADKNFSEWIPALAEWVASIGKPLLIGLPLLALPLAVTGYFAVHGAWRLYVMHAWRRRTKQRKLKSGSNV